MSPLAVKRGFLAEGWWLQFPECVRIALVIEEVCCFRNVALLDWLLISMTSLGGKHCFKQDFPPVSGLYVHLDSCQLPQPCECHMEGLQTVHCYGSEVSQLGRTVKFHPSLQFPYCVLVLWRLDCRKKEAFRCSSTYPWSCKYAGSSVIEATVDY